jgi:hypothetical protein
MKNGLALTHERWERWTGVGAGVSPRRIAVGAGPWALSPRGTVAGAGPWGLSPRRIAVGAGPWGLSPRLLKWALAGELATVVFLFASGSVPSALVRSLQLFLRF